jgi:hypothetical protein
MRELTGSERRSAGADQVAAVRQYDEYVHVLGSYARWCVQSKGTAGGQATEPTLQSPERCEKEKEYTVNSAAVW